MARKQNRLGRDVGLVLGGGAFLYLIVATCATGVKPEGKDASQSMDVLADLVADLASPVPDANAQGTPATVTTTCNTELGTSGQFMAIANFPGKTRDQLNQAYAIAQTVTMTQGGYTHWKTTSLLLKDGGVAYICGTSASVAAIASITFYAP